MAKKIIIKLSMLIRILMKIGKIGCDPVNFQNAFR